MKISFTKIYSTMAVAVLCVFFAQNAFAQVVSKPILTVDSNTTNPTNNLPLRTLYLGQKAVLEWSNTNTGAISCKNNFNNNTYTNGIEWHVKPTTTGVITYTVTCIKPDNTTISASETLTVLPNPNTIKPLEVTLTVDSRNSTNSLRTIKQGDTAILEWLTYETAVSCKNNFNNNTYPTGIDFNVKPSVTTTYTVICTNAAGQTASASETLTVIPNSVLTPKFNIYPKDGEKMPLNSGTEVAIEWTRSDTNGATECEFTGIGINQRIGAGNLEGLIYQNPQHTITYTLKCWNTNTGATGTISKTVNVKSSTYSDSPVTNFTVNRNTITIGESVDLSWYSQNSSSCTNTFSNSTAKTGAATVKPTATTTYSVTCLGINGRKDTREQKVVVNGVPSRGGDIAPMVTLTVSRNVIRVGESVDIAWSSSDASSCDTNFVNSSAKAGSVTLTPSATTTYRVTCYGDNNRQDTKEQLVTVNRAGGNGDSGDHHRDGNNSHLCSPAIILKKGSRSNDRNSVMLLKRILEEQGFFEGNTNNGAFGPLLKAAVLDAEAEYGLTVDGKVSVCEFQYYQRL